jgi:hypothetical protein
MSFMLDDILANVFQFCSASTIYCTIPRVCKQWHKIIQAAPSGFWYEVYANQFPICEIVSTWEEWKAAEIVKDPASHLWSCGCLERFNVAGSYEKGDIAFRNHRHRQTDWKDAFKVTRGERDRLFIIMLMERCILSSALSCAMLADRSGARAGCLSGPGAVRCGLLYYG